MQPSEVTYRPEGTEGSEKNGWRKIVRKGGWRNGWHYEGNDNR